MKKHLKKVLALVLICAALISSSMPAAAASGGWHNWGCGKCETVYFSTGKTATYRVLTQQQGLMNLYNTFKRRVTTTGYANGSYRVTIVQVRDSRGCAVNKTICKNRLWASSGLNAKLTKGTYKMTVRSLGYVTPSKCIWGPYTPKSWRYYPKWKIG